MEEQAPERMLEKGDIVRLRSGGPIMTVFGVAQSGLVSAIWFTPDGLLHTGSFEPETLSAPGLIPKKHA